jgi:CheY-like chemotaxis protein
VLIEVADTGSGMTPEECERIFTPYYTSKQHGTGLGLAIVLIVDDDANTLASLARAFRLAGHEATVCDNAARALELARAERFDLILSDVVMPGRDGIAAGGFEGEGLASPVVMMSGQASIEMAVKATRLGAGFSGEAHLQREALADGGKCAEAAAPGRRKPRLEAALGQASHRVGGRGDARK